MNDLYEHAKRFNEFANVPLRIAGFVVLAAGVAAFLGAPEWISALVGCAALMMLVVVFVAFKLRPPESPEPAAPVDPPARAPSTAFDMDGGSEVRVRGQARFRNTPTIAKMRGGSKFDAGSIDSE